jgi:hypothetical protein
MSKFERRLQLGYHFYISESYGGRVEFKDNRKDNIFGPIPSTYQPKNKSPDITKFTDKLYKNITKRNNKPILHNLSKPQKLAIDRLRDRPIIIRPADKNAGICIINILDYENKCFELLKTEDYEIIQQLDIENIRKGADKILQKYANLNVITEEEYNFSTSFDTKLPKFYGNPKVHKTNCPYRPIVSQIDGPTSRLNMLVDHLLTNTENHTKNLIKDTLQFLKIIVDKQIPNNSILVTLDVTSLYTRIPWKEGIDTVLESVGECDPTVNIELLQETLYYILENNHFTYGKDKLFRQTNGTAMGSRMAVKYANIYMGKKFEKTMIGSKFRPHFYCRLIDDIFIIWTHGIETLKEFHAHLNLQDKNIQYELNFNDKEITFLDTIVVNCENFLHTKNYIKPTNKQMYLYATSNHPIHTITSLPLSQALRIRRNTTNDEDLKIQINQLIITFQNRGYSKMKIERSINKIYRHTQRSLIKNQAKKNNVRIPLILPFQPAFIGLGTELRKLWEKHILSKENLAIIFKDYPMIGHSKMTTIGSLITSSLYPPKWKTDP